MEKLLPTTTWRDLLHPGNATDFFARTQMPKFDPHASGYSRENALWLMELSRLAYRHDTEEENPPPQPTRNSFLVKAGLRQRNFFLSRETNTQAMLVEPLQPPEFAALVFRGTEQTVNDFTTDLNVGSLRLDDGNIAVHQGFRKALDSVWNEIDTELAKLACTVFYTGHSLGAALATLAAARRRPHAVYTFGSPRVGNRLFANSLAGVPIYRIVDDKDIATTVPLEIMGFCHTGSEHRLTAPPGNLSFQDILNPPKPLADHAPINYVDRL